MCVCEGPAFPRQTFSQPPSRTVGPLGFLDARHKQYFPTHCSPFLRGQCGNLTGPEEEVENVVRIAQQGQQQQQLELAKAERWGIALWRGWGVRLRSHRHSRPFQKDTYRGSDQG